MALGVKYRLDYSDEQLISWRADILQEGFVGSITEVKMGGKPVTIEMRDIDDPFTPVCHTEATLTLMSESLGQYDEFKTGDVYEYSLEVERDGTLFWQGILLTEPFTEAFESAPYEIELKFSDGISELSYERYDVAGTLQGEFTSVIGILVKCFNKLPISRGFREIINLFEDRMDDADAEGLLEQLIIYEPAFWEVDKSDDIIKGEPALEVIEGICYSLKCRIVVSQDIYYIIRIAETKTLGTVKYVDYNSSGTVTGNGTIDLRKDTSGRTEVLPDLLAHLSGASIDINKQYQEVEFTYSSKNITTLNNSLLVNPYFEGGYEEQNGAPVPLYWGRSDELNDLLDITPTALHLTTGYSYPSANVPNDWLLVMEDDLLKKTRIRGSYINANIDPHTSGGVDYLSKIGREEYNLFAESPANNTITYKNLYHSTDDNIEIRIKGWFDYTYSDPYTEVLPSGIGGASPLIRCSFKVILDGKYYHMDISGNFVEWSTDDNDRAHLFEWGKPTDDEILEMTDPPDARPKKRRHYFDRSIILASTTSEGISNLSITWYIPDNFRVPDIEWNETISAFEIVFNSLEVNYISDSSTEFSIHKVLGETDSTTLRTRRYKSEVKHSDGPSNFSVMSFRIPTNLITKLWSSRGGSEGLPGYEWDIKSVFENLGTYRIIFNGDLYGLLEMHNIVNLIQESKILLIKGMRFDTKHNIYELKLHEVGSFSVPIDYTVQFGLSAFTGLIVTEAAESENPFNTSTDGYHAVAETTWDSNTETQSYTQVTHIQTNNDTGTLEDFPLIPVHP